MPDGATGRPIRVLEAAARYVPDLGGVETHVFEVAQRLALRPDLDVTVAATDRRNEYPARDSSGPVPVLRCRAWPAHRDYYIAPGLVPIIRDGEWDVVHVQGVHTAAPIISMLAARRSGVPYVVSFHSGGTSSGVRRILRSAQWRALAPLLAGASRLVAVSRFEQQHFAAALRLPAERITVIRNGGGLPELDTPVATVPGRIVSCGRLERYKGHHRVIEALPEIVRSIPEAHLHILGAGPFEGDLRRLASRLGVADRVSIRLVPPGDRHAMAVALAESAAVCALSDYEAHPVAVMEAVAAGVPVVGTDTAGIGDLVEDGLVRGVAVGASSREVAGSVVAAIAAGPPARPALPTWDDAADALAGLYAGVVERGRPDPVPVQTGG